MRFATVFAALAAVSSVSAATLGGDLRSLLVRQNANDIPTCADDCFANPPATDCNGSNKCLCENEAFVAGETQCLQAACSGADLATAEAFSRALCLSVGVTLTQTTFPASTDSSTSSTDSATDSSTSSAAASTTDLTTSSAPAGSSTTPAGTVSGTTSGTTLPPNTVTSGTTLPASTVTTGKTSATGSGTQSSPSASATGSGSTSGASAQRFSVLALVGAVVLGACAL